MDAFLFVLLSLYFDFVYNCVSLQFIRWLDCVVETSCLLLNANY